MASEKQIAYINEWKRQNVRRVSLELPKEKYEEVARAAQRAGESVNGYIKTAIQMRMEKEGRD